MEKPFIRGYNHDEQLQNDIKKLKDDGCNANDIYVISHDKDRTQRIIDNESASMIKVEGDFDKPGDELRAQLLEVGFDEVEAESFEGEMDTGTVFLICTNPEHAKVL